MLREHRIVELGCCSEMAASLRRETGLEALLQAWAGGLRSRPRSCKGAMAILVVFPATAGARGVAGDARHRSIPSGLREILEAGVLTEECQPHGADRPIALLADDDLGYTLVL